MKFVGKFVANVQTATCDWCEKDEPTAVIRGSCYGELCICLGCARQVVRLLEEK